jgi:hypothetical protein
MKTAACTLLSVRVELVQAHLRMIRVCSKWAWTSSARTVVVDAGGLIDAMYMRLSEQFRPAKRMNTAQMQ